MKCYVLHKTICQRLLLTTLVAAVLGTSRGLAADTANTTQTGGSLTSPDAIRLALEDNPELRAFRERVQAATGRSTKARAWPNPELELGVEEWPTDRGFSDAKQTLGVAQTVPFPGKKRLDRQIGRAGITSASAELRWRELELVRAVKSAFFRALGAERIVEEQARLVTLVESSATDARRRVQAGAAPDQEQLRAEIPLEQARGELLRLQQESAIGREELLALLGGDHPGSTRLAGTLAEIPPESALQSPPADWVDRHPRMLMASSARAEAELATQRTGLEPYPDVKLGVAGGREAVTGHSIVEFRVGLPLPIFDRAKGQQQEAQAAVRIAQAQEEHVHRQLCVQRESAKLRLTAAAAQAAQYRERILPKAEAALRLVQAGFDQGKFGFIDLLDTQRTLAEARLSYQQRLLDLNLAQAELESFHLAVPSQPGTQPASPISN